jgi:serine/threonine protein kinase
MHRDLKPENILLRGGKNYECIIADFGLVEKVNADELMFPRCGTPGYVAPEIATLKDKNVRYESSCDIFSLGVIFHVLLLGKTPFSGITHSEVMKQNKKCNINFETQIYKRLSEYELNLLKRMLEKDSSLRITA